MKNRQITKVNASNNNKSLDKAKGLLRVANKLTIKTLVNSSNALQDSSDATYVGIDFGTSTTVVSIAKSQNDLSNLQSNPIEINQKLYDGAIYNSYKIPTMVAWFRDKLLFGEAANQIKLKLKQGKNLWHSFKMELGEDVGAKYPESELNNGKYTILNPKDVTTLFFKYLKIQIEKYIKENNFPKTIQYAVSIPASFEANQRKDLIDSLHANNMMLDKQALIDEPNAAFLSCISSDDLRNDVYISDEYPTNILVFDFGAGTCDISILEIANGAKGYYSKNLAISRFEALGGNDIDKKIAKDILFKQFLEENSIDKNTFKRKEISIILSRLEKPAELLKIKISEQFDLIKNNHNFKNLIQNDTIVQINHKIEIKSKKGVYELSKPKLSYKEFIKIIEDFSKIEINECSEKNIKSIFKPIESALKKAFLSQDEIDYILFIGGSAKNPIIQKVIKKYFKDSEYLIPSSLQAHVSAGAAIHSLMFNGHKKNLINPITSESILSVVKDDSKESLITLVKAGTKIPCDDITIDNLKPQRKNQKIIEIPLYIGTEEKLLHNIMIDSKNTNGFPLKTNIKLIISISVDKMLLVKAIIDNEEIRTIEPLNPFSNAITTFKDRQKFELEKEYNRKKANNQGKSNLQSLETLYKGYEKLDLELDKAETLEELYEQFKYGSLNNIGVAYSNAGDKEKAMMFYKKDFKENPSEVSAFNIAMRYKYTNKSEFIKWMEKSLDIDPNYESTLYYYGAHLVEKGEEKKGLKMVNKAFGSWKNDYENGHLNSNIDNFVSCARYLEKYDLVNKLENEIKEKEETIGDYNKDNLTAMKEK